MSVVLVVQFLLVMKCIPITTTSLDLLWNHESGRGVVGGGNVSSSSAGKKYYQCLDKERDALLIFKAGLRDDRDILSSWSSQEQDCCKWWGVHCSSRTGHVIELHLHGQGLDSDRQLMGKISQSLFQLHHLNYLDLSDNNFSDESISKFIGSLTNLKYLDLSDCGFFGTIPPQLGNLSNLTYLNLRGNSFPDQSIPKFIVSLANLKYLDLSACGFGGTIPSQLGNLSNLNYLNLRYNNYLETNLVEWLPHLTSLRHLYLDDVDLSKAIHWPRIINSLPFLSHVSFSGCGLPNVTYPSPSLINSSTTPSSITDLDLSYNDLTSSMFHWLFILSTSLVNLTLSHNQLNGPIPQDFGKFTSLALLDLSYNQQEDGIPKSFRNLCSLQTLGLASNNISGNLAASLNNLQSGCAVVTLEDLDVSENNLTGSLPDDIVRFSSLSTLRLANNRLNGSVSENLGKLSKLEMLDLSENSLCGNLSEAHFLNLHNLVHLDLSFNSLALAVNSTWVPSFQLVDLRMISCKPGPNSLDWIQTQKNLTNLDLSNCGISANIPTSFWDQLTSLNYLNLSTNQIRGKVPDFPSNFGTRTYESLGRTIDLSSNLFEGPIPLFPSSVEALYLFKNNFSGSLSVLCQSMEKDWLTFLDLSHNILNGSLPDCLMQFTTLFLLNLAYNNFSQNIPNSIGSLVNLVTLNLHDNNFFGELPLSLRNCTSLSFLDVGENKLSGNIPAWIGEELELLYFLRLRSNNFSGVIPLHLCQLAYLQILDLSMNNFFGSIPPCLNNLSAMVNVESSTHVSEHGYASAMVNVNNSIHVSKYVYYTDYYREYFDSALVEWQGREREFVKTLGLLKIIDLSSNQLTGEVPNAITTLRGLVVLNLSRNKLHGKIPEEIGQLNSSLQYLNFSRNEFSGSIPQGIAVLSFLSHLDLSHNNFSGRIPSGRQLDTLDPSTFAENAGLCGPPLTQKCRPGDELPPIVLDSDDHQEDSDEFRKWLYIGMSTGFITGFWGICGALLLNRRCRHAFFCFFDSFKDSLYVKVAILFRNRRV